MSYVKPQVLVFQEFSVLPTEIADPLRAMIAGPHAGLHRYTTAAEKAAVALGEYDPVADAEYAYPGKAAGSVVDLDYTRLFVDDGLLRYFTDAVGTGSTIAPVAGYRNRVRSSSVVWKTANDVDRAAALYDRDVRTGDRVYVRGVGDGDEVFELSTYVTGFVAEPTASTRGSATSDAANAASQGAATSVDKIGGGDNTITLTVDASTYDGTPDGSIDEYYTIEVTRSSVNGDLTTAVLRVTSASGLDNVLAVTPAAVGGWTAIGTRGLQVEFDRTETASASSAAVFDDVSPDDLVAGQKWRVHVIQAFTAPTPTAAGTYSGTVDDTLVIEVTKGGAFASDADPEVTVTTARGSDNSGPTAVTASGLAVAAGNYDVTIAFAGTHLRKGDKYYVVCTAAGEGAVQTLVLGHDLPEELADTADLHLELYIRKNFEITANRTGSPPDTNWEATATEFTTKAGVTAYDSTWTDGGTELALELVGGSLFLHYREWLTDYVGVVESVTDPADVSGLLGTVDPDNPLAYGVYKAASNANGTAVRFSAVANPTDLDKWAELLDTAQGRDDVYNLVPLSADRAVHDLFAAHVSAQSSPEAGLWRACFVPLAAVETKEIVGPGTSSDGAVVLAKIKDNPAAAGTQYTLLEISSANADLTDLGVRAGDTVRFLFTTDGFGTEAYSTFAVASVRSGGTLVLETAHTAAVSVAQRVEIWRTQKKAEVAADLAASAGSFGSRRVCAVWPDRISAGGVDVPGYYLCAALAGLRSGVVPHQALTNVEIQGFDNAKRSSEYFSNSHLDTAAAGGGLVVTQDRDGNILTRHGITTDVDNVNDREEMIRANVDNMSYVFLNQLKIFIGRSNVTPSALRQIETTIRATIEFLKSRGFTESLGGQLIDGQVVEVRPHTLLKDRVVAVVSLTIPYALNNLECYLVV